MFLVCTDISFVTEAMSGWSPVPNFVLIVSIERARVKSKWLPSDIDHVLSGFPGEMTPRYDRMMEKIEKHSESTKRMATMLLAWAVYCFRPLQLNELTVALNSEFPDFTSLEDTIKHICSDFIQMRGTKVTLVHETARHYLITRYPSNSALLHPTNSHEYIATVCLQYLSTSKDHQWRPILNMAEIGRSPGSLFALSSGRDIHETYPFLAYAATSWAYHLSLADPVAGPLLDALLNFFSNDSLTWINTLALFGDLKSLIKAAQYLRAYLKSRKKKLAEEPLPGLETDSTITLRLWAIDLIRLVGKFGSNLIQYPSSIYRLIPPFCPINSMLRKASGQSTFSVEGVSMADWDDCHARLSVGNEGSGRRVLATSEVFMALVPGAHSLVVWHAETCEELRRLRHKEYVTEVAINRKGDLVCTTGRSTIKVWELSTGREVGSFNKHSDDKILAVGFGAGDDHLLTGYQDHLIVCQNWRTRDIVYSFHAVLKDDDNVHNGLRVVSFSPDGKNLIVGSRNRPVDLWDLSTQSRAARCVMRDEISNADNDVFLQPEVVQWHPNSGNIYILYHNTALIDWDPAYDEKTEHHLGAKGMACSPCGKYLLTYGADGSVKVFGLPDYSRSQKHSLRPIYHLVHPEHVRDVTFGPDGRRFYDLRDSICSVWEPERTTSMSSLAPVTAIACAPKDLGFCCGRDDGAISVHEMRTGTKIRFLPGHVLDMAIIGLTWSSSGRWIASADDSGRVLVRKVHMPMVPDQKMKVYKPSDFRISSDGINQLLFSSNDRYLLDLAEKRICHVREHPSPRRIKWIEHPSDPSRLVSIEADEVHIFNWNDFLDLTPGNGLRFAHTDQKSITGKRKIASPLSDSLESLRLMVNPILVVSASLEVNSIMQIGDKGSIVLETLPPCGYDQDRLKRRRIEFIQATDLSPSMVSGELILQLSAPELTREVLKLVGSYQNHLVFFNVQKHIRKVIAPFV
ncbi:WD40 repeat-like protein [Delitschia confertaspora ATCC 74209]|uniref:WD40 repeat-like protein n=1 Tax=Delitschia confertaspora ATCC 74209 TaxID=1513339 RepID=A0A9P4JR01_9PLEO|nr:WD40 repeat-like protein [Delitschia confertaspora ATCC 74209]